MKYVVKNRCYHELWINLPDPEHEGRLLRSVRLAPREAVELTEEEYQSMDVQAKIREGVLLLVKTI